MNGGHRMRALQVVVVILLTHCPHTLAGFAEVPSSVTTDVNNNQNQNAVFRCRHERSDGIIVWLINGLSTTRYSDVRVGSISESDGTFVATLTIPASSVYNGAEIVCLATFDDGSPSEDTTPVLFNIRDLGQSPTTDLRAKITPSPTTNPTDIPPSRTFKRTTFTPTTTVNPLSRPTKVKDPSSSSSKGLIAGIHVVVTFFLFVVIMVIVLLIVVRKRWKKKVYVVENIESGGVANPASSADDRNRTENEATLHYESILPQGSRAKVTDRDDVFELVQPLLPSSPLPSTRQGETKELSEASTTFNNTAGTDLSYLSVDDSQSSASNIGDSYLGSADAQPLSNEKESPPPVPLRTEESDGLVDQSTHPSSSHQDTASTGSTIQQPRSSSPSGVTSPPPFTEHVVYDDVKGFNNPEGQHYAMLKEVSTSNKTCTPDDSDLEKIQPVSPVPTTAAVGVHVEPNTSSSRNTANTDPPFTVEHIFPTLLFMASKWQALGKALSLDEDRLDEIFTNNETDEACLNVMLEHYMKRSDLKHSWEEVREAKRKVEEKDGGTEELEPTSQRSQEGTNIITSIDAIGEPVVEKAEENQSNHPVPPHYPSDVCTISKNVYTPTVPFTTSTGKRPSNNGECVMQSAHHDGDNDVVDDVEVVTESKENEIQNHKEGQSSVDNKEIGDENLIEPVEQTSLTDGAIERTLDPILQILYGDQKEIEEDVDDTYYTDDKDAAFPSGDQISKWDQASCEVNSHLKSQLQVKDCIASSAMEVNSQCTQQFPTSKEFQLNNQELLSNLDYTPAHQSSEHSSQVIVHTGCPQYTERETSLSQESQEVTTDYNTVLRKSLGVESSRKGKNHKERFPTPALKKAGPGKDHSHVPPQCTDIKLSGQSGGIVVTRQTKQKQFNVHGIHTEQVNKGY